MRRLLLAAVLLGASFAGCAGSEDGDGLQPEAEERGWNVRVTYPNQTVVNYAVTSDPGVADTDGDGVNDFLELQRGSDPRNVDTDQDRLADGSTLCPDAGTDLASAVQEAELIEHPTEPGCFVGEASWDYDGTQISTDSTDAHSDNGAGIGDDLTDGEEIEGWTVEIGGRSYHVFSNPSTRSPDSDGDGLHDGLEKKDRLDPMNKDTDDDGVGDRVDAAPLGNLLVTFRVERFNLKTDYKVTGGADLLVQAHVAGMQEDAGPRSVSSGESRPNLRMRIDVPDKATTFDEDGAGAGNWVGDMRFSFLHDSQGDGDPIEVRQDGSDRHVLRLRYDAFEDTWTGHARGGTSSGPDADVTFELNSVVE